MFKLLLAFLSLLSLGNAQFFSIFNNTKCVGDPVFQGNANTCTPIPNGLGGNVYILASCPSSGFHSLQIYSTSSCNGAVAFTFTGNSWGCSGDTLSGLTAAYNQSAPCSPASNGWMVKPILGLMLMVLLIG